MTTEKTRSSKQQLPLRPSEANQTLEALGKGEVDAVVVHGSRGPNVHSLIGPDRPFHTFIEHMRQGAVTLDADDVILYCNASFAELLKAPVENVMGARMASFLPASAREAYRRIRQQCFRAPVRERLSLVSSAGEEIEAQFSFNPLPGMEPQSCCVVVTDLREEERARREQVAREAAESASLAREQFLALLSHELRAPLHAILGWAQVLTRMGVGDPQMRRGIDAIERNARAQAQLVSDLLDMSAITLGKLRLNKRIIDVQELVSSVIASILPSAEERSLRLESSLAPEEGKVEGDDERLRQIVSNLLTNAVKFTSDGGAIRVRLRRVDSWVEIEVEDDGEGISPEFLPRLFERFEQDESALHRAAGGLGLGMAIVKQLTELHRGVVTAESEGAGRGATFSVRLPAAEGAVAAAEAVSEHALSGKQVLLVDDDADAREVLGRGLAACGAEVLSASGTDDALRILESARPDLLVSDILMPRRDGYELIREVRVRGFGAGELPAIALSALAGPGEANRALEAGYQIHVPKPVDVEQLSATVSRLLGESLPGGEGSD